MNNPKFDKFLVENAEFWDAYVSERGANNLGRMYFWLKRDGVIDFDDLTEEELIELRALYKKYKKILRELFNFDGPLNFAYLANEESHKHHCHYHLVPRYKTSRTFSGVEFNDVSWGSIWTSAKMDDELTIKLAKEISIKQNEYN